MSRYLKSIGAWYVIDYPRRHKTCAQCQTEFCDLSKGAWRQTCSKPCGDALKLERARAGGAYDWDDARRQKNAETVRQNRASGKVKNPWSRDDVKERIKQTNLKRYGVENWKQTSAGRASTIKLNKIRVRSSEERQKHRLNNLRRAPGAMRARGKAFIRPDIGFFRSTWEANYVRILNLTGRVWEYEPCTFTLSCGITYTPDFYIDGGWVEVKGWMDPKSKLQLEHFILDFPDQKLQIIGPKEYYELQAQYAHLIKEWEWPS
jgi:hypothetical protein